MNTKKLLIAVVAILFSTIGFAQLPTSPGKFIYKTKADTTAVKKIKILSKEELYNAPLTGSSNRIISDKHYIKKGDSFRLKYIFQPDEDVIGLVLDGKNIKRKDIDFKKGVWEITLTPEKSHIYHLKVLSSKYSPLTLPMQIVVLDPDEYEKVDAKAKEFIKNEDGENYYKFIRELLDKHCGPVDMRKILFSR